MIEWIKLPWGWTVFVFGKLKQLWKIGRNAEYLVQQEQIIKLKEENQHLNEQLVINDNAKFDGEFLWLSDERICLRCWDDSSKKDRKVSRLTRNNPKVEGCYYCQNCNARYRSKKAESQLDRLHSKAVQGLW